MDDTARSQTDAQPVTGPVPPPPAPVQPAQHAPVSLPHKEHTYGGSTSGRAEVAPSAPEPEIPSEVAEAGVAVVPDPAQPTIHTTAATAGLTHAKDTVPVQTQPTLGVTLPMTNTQATAAKKKYGIKFSIRWMAELVLEQLKRSSGRQT